MKENGERLRMKSFIWLLVTPLICCRHTPPSGNDSRHCTAIDFLRTLECIAC